MRKILLLLVVMGCQSQADKDREEMKFLIKEKDRLTRITMQLDISKSNEEVKAFERYSKLSDSLLQLPYSNIQDIKDNSEKTYTALEEEANSKRMIRKKYDSLSRPYLDSLSRIEKRIDDLKLLMGK